MGWPAAEVCDALEISEGNQRVLLSRARTRVRAALERYHDAVFLASDEAAYITARSCSWTAG